MRDLKANKPVPILFVIDHFLNPYAGTEGQLFHLIKHLPRDQFSPELLVLQGGEYVESGQMPCPVHVLGSHRIADPRTWLLLFRFARKKKRNGLRLAHVFFNDSSILGPPVFRVCGIKTIISRRDMGYWYTSGYLKVLRLTGKLVDGVIVNSIAVQKVTTRQEKIPQKRVSVIYNGYEESVTPNSSGRRELEELRNSAKGPLVVIVANLRPIKRIGDAIEAVARLQAEGVPLHLVVIGGGDSEPLQQLAIKSGVHEQVVFLGSRSDVRVCLEYMDIALLCSESEGYSNAIVEYMNAGLPVVASDVGGNPEAVVNGETGFLYPMGDVDDIAHHLRYLAENLNARKAQGSRGQQIAKERHALQTMINAHIDVYERLLNAPAAGIKTKVSS